MHYWKILPILLFHGLSVIALHAQQINDELIVAVSPKVLMRSEASIQGKMVGAVPVGAIVKIIAISEAPQEVMNVTGHWVKVDYKGKAGWIFRSLLKRATDRHSVRILNGTIILDDPNAVASADVAQLVQGVTTADIDLEVVTIPPDSMRQCEGTLVLRQGGKLRNGKNTFRCGGVSGESFYRITQWQTISGQIYFTAEKTSSEVCHSENCKEGSSRATKTTLPFRNVKMISPKKFTTEF